MVLKNQNLLHPSKGKKNRQKLLKGEDRISELPDAVLLHILSFLPTKCVVSTSILSKRWRYLWTTIPILDFRKWGLSLTGNETFEDYHLRIERFMNFVDRMLSLHDMTNIQKFYLDCDDQGLIQQSRITEWVSTLMRHKIEELILYLSLEDAPPFPPCLFTCESLTMLEIEAWELLELPKSISFPKLKILRLSSVIFIDANLTQQLFSNCPVLEELILTSCCWSMEVVCISVPTLKRLSIAAPVTDWRDGLNDCRVEIYAPNLLSLVYIERVAKDYVLHSFSSLVDAEIGFTDFELVSCASATKLLEKLSNVKSLKISDHTVQALSFPGVIITDLPTFHNLIHLEVSLKICSSTDKTMLDFLHISPNLESLVFAQDFYEHLSYIDDDWILDMVPECLLLHLKSVEFREFYGHLEELSVVNFFLENARVLQRMTIVSADKSTDLKNEIMKYLRSSMSCVINFS